jgi:hypothetical protein
MSNENSPNTLADAMIDFMNEGKLTRHSCYWSDKFMNDKKYHSIFVDENIHFIKDEIFYSTFLLT